MLLSTTHSNKPSQQVTKQKPFILIQGLISLHQIQHHMMIFQPLQMLPRVFYCTIAFQLDHICLHRLYAVLSIPLSAGALYGEGHNRLFSSHLLTLI